MKSAIKTISAGLSLAAILACGSRLMADPIPIDYSNLVSTSIDFNGTGGFSFSSTGTPAANIQLDDSTAAGLLGYITGNFTIVGITNDVADGYSTADVDGVGSLTIYDGSTDLTAILTWGQMIQYGSGDALNFTAAVDLTNIAYGGSNADLLALAKTGYGINVLSFQFSADEALSQLATTKISTSYSGTMVSAVPDNGTTALLIGLGAAGIVFSMIIQRRKSA